MNTSQLISLAALCLSLTALYLQFKSTTDFKTNDWGERLARRYNLNHPSAIFITLTATSALVYWTIRLWHSPDASDPTTLPGSLSFLSGALMINVLILGRIGVTTYLKDLNDNTPDQSH